jgi:hypothetical protein
VVEGVPTTKELIKAGPRIWEELVRYREFPVMLPVLMEPVVMRVLPEKVFAVMEATFATVS